MIFIYKNVKLLVTALKLSKHEPINIIIIEIKKYTIKKLNCKLRTSMQFTLMYNKVVKLNYSAEYSGYTEILKIAKGLYVRTSCFGQEMRY